MREKQLGSHCLKGRAKEPSIIRDDAILPLKDFFFPSTTAIHVNQGLLYWAYGDTYAILKRSSKAIKRSSGVQKHIVAPDAEPSSEAPRPRGTGDEAFPCENKVDFLDGVYHGVPARPSQRADSIIQCPRNFSFTSTVSLGTGLPPMSRAAFNLNRHLYLLPRVPLGGSLPSYTLIPSLGLANMRVCGVKCDESIRGVFKKAHL